MPSIDSPPLPATSAPPTQAPTTGTPPRSRGRPGLVLGLACSATFMVGLDVAIVNVALPSIERDLGLTQGSLQRVVVAYALVLGGFLLVGGRMTDLGRRIS